MERTQQAMRRILSVLLVVALLITQTPLWAYAQDGTEPATAPPALGYSAIVAFAPLDEEVAEQAAVTGTVPEDLALPDTLSATVENGDGEQAQAEIPVEGWSAEPEYDPLVPGIYLFSPELPEGYTLEDGVEPPEITVRVFMGFAPMAFAVTVNSYADLATEIGNYASANDDMEIVLGTTFPTDTMPGEITIPGNTNGNYTLTIRSFDSSSPASITRGSGIIGALFEVSSGAHLILEDVVLDGNNVAANNSLVYVGNGGAFTMRAGAVLRDNNSGGSGGGVFVSSGSDFTMEGGEISDNAAIYDGGGVHVWGGTFTMEGGEISGNAANANGGGVYVWGGTFTMKGGEISGNDAAGGGGGVYVGSSDFTMKEGEISGNSASVGGGVYVVSGGAFTMEDGEISGNSAARNGGGVYVTGSGTNFTMEGGEISDNAAIYDGGGVYVWGGTFTMEGGEISGNRATNGSGVYFSSTFTMKDGLIFGRGGDTQSVVFSTGTWTPDASGDGVVIAWNEAAGNTRYFPGTHDDISWLPLGAQVRWAASGGERGIAYKKDSNEGFIPLPVQDMTAPTAPQNLRAVAGDAQVTLNWDAPADSGGAIAYYEVSSDNGATWPHTTTSPSHTVTGLTNGTSYTFQVRAVNAVGAGPATSVMATPMAGGNEGGATDTLTLAPLSHDTVTIGYNYRKTISYSYSGGSAVSFQVTGLPAGLAFDSATGIISGVPTDAAGQYPVQVTVTAGSLSAGGGYTLTLTTTATAASLTMEPLADETITVGNAYARVPAVTYIGPDTLAFSATGLPTGLSIDSATGRISGTPTVADAYDITVTVREETGSLSASQGYRLTVTGRGSSSSGRSSSSGSSGGSSTPDSARAKTQLPASAFSWDGGRTLTIDHSGITPLGLLSVRWDGETLVRGTDYTVHSGSVILRFDEDFIAAQRDGSHTVRVEFMNHYGETTVTVGGTGTAGDATDPADNDTHNPNTGGYPTGQANGTDNPETGGGRGIWAALLAGSLSAAALVILRRGDLAANAPE